MWRWPPRPTGHAAHQLRGGAPDRQPGLPPVGAGRGHAAAQPAHHPGLCRPVGAPGRRPGLRRLPATGQLVHVLVVVVQDHRRLDRAATRGPTRLTCPRGCPSASSSAGASCSAGSSPATTGPPTAAWWPATASCSSRSAWRSPCSWRRSTPGGSTAPTSRPGTDYWRRMDRSWPSRPGSTRAGCSPRTHRRTTAARASPVLRGALHRRPQGAGRAGAGRQPAHRRLRAAPGRRVRGRLAGAVHRPRHASPGVPRFDRAWSWHTWPSSLYAALMSRFMVLKQADEVLMLAGPCRPGPAGHAAVPRGPAGHDGAADPGAADPLRPVRRAGDEAGGSRTGARTTTA